MENERLEVAMCDLVDGIKDAHLGSVQSVVIDDAVRALICSWNDHNSDYKIDVSTELNNWEAAKLKGDTYAISRTNLYKCHICGEPGGH